MQLIVLYENQLKTTQICSQKLDFRTSSQETYSYQKFTKQALNCYQLFSPITLSSVIIRYLGRKKKRKKKTKHNT